MPLEEEIMNAVGAHGVWKMRLKSAIESGKSQFQVATVQKDNQCDFGKWLHSLQATAQTSEHYKKVRQLHSEFHREAAHVLDLALNGKKADAEKSVTAGGAFFRLSSELTAGLMSWKNAGQ